MAVLSEWSRRQAVSSWLAVPSIAGALVFTAGWLIAGRVQDQYDPRSDYISSLAAVGAANPEIMIAALVLFGIGVMSLGAGLVHSFPDPLGRIASFGVLLSGLGVLVAGSMRHDCGLQLPDCSARVSLGEISGYHAVHDVASAATFMFAGASQLLLSRAMRRRDGWRYLRLPSVASGMLTLLLFVLMISGEFAEWVGALQRTIVVVGCIWVCMLAIHLIRLGMKERGRKRLRDGPSAHEAGSPAGLSRQDHR
ncbi:DUF998 domain-containing protein [Phytoactinopolyspora mesophila]|uniref:DUF998 domain-containing protein n=1 Tax=Phytoactinopolyspora mesophila TaxID=2650750 RepID=A0A7K3LYT6_9ACTN|nr:DUF998 domain-containing protein [Phytoactinopolyspora mesophila]NDL56160.1 DUF998 domain-containing protein [Phytoactinopolyspora mesophila]